MVQKVVNNCGFRFTVGDDEVFVFSWLSQKTRKFSTGEEVHTFSDIAW